MVEVAAQSTSKINWKSVLIGVILGALLVGIIGFTFWYFTRSKESENSSTNTTKTSTSLAKKDETADWKTYKGETILVSFKIPPNFSVKDQKGGIQNTYFEGLITVSDEKGEARFAVINAGTGPMMYPLYTEDIIIDGIKGIKTSWVYYKDPSNLNLGPEDRGEPRSITISFSGKSGVINYVYSKENEELMKKVLPTFKFL